MSFSEAAIGIILWNKLFLKFLLFTGKHLCCSLVLVKMQVWKLVTLLETPTRACYFIKKDSTQVFYCEYCGIFKNTYFEIHLRTASSGFCIKLLFWLVNLFMHDAEKLPNILHNSCMKVLTVELNLQTNLKLAASVTFHFLF